VLLVKSRIQVSNESFAPVVPSMKFSYLGVEKVAPRVFSVGGRWLRSRKLLLFFPDYNHLVENTKSDFQRNHYYLIQKKCYPLAYMALLSLSWSSGIANVLHRLWCKVETDSETPQRFLSSLPIDEAWCSCQWECPKVLSSSSAIDLCCLALQWSAYHWLLTNQ